MLEVKNLTAIRDERVLFEGLSFTIQSGELVQIEGRNGTGKTTLLRIVTGLGDRDDGEIHWNNVNIEADRDSYHQELLFLGHQTGVKRELTALENLRFYQAVHAAGTQEEDLYQALTQVGLAGREDVPVAQLSAGQQRRVALARLWLSRQKLWILDEPLTAIDKQGVKVLEALFLQHAEQGGIVVLTTHQDMFADNPKLRKIKLGDA
ncbi:cytochrome c biogenesis heme-transporting ATPase CcmA [Vibrio fluvialis]|jgi:heme exporter protein A|uniref:ABC transporter involved in cytochrome c biogenesis, ATPase component CcmA n=1 Tax=Vibrio fluvialis PG41 TaxID=1336752 RepID=S7JAC8_VIBFL|nr:cytochrome c biogenesis heme-transporting ATPase CcmA [Vibrio fluvialis]EKO3366658.1 cytochrome c biogenesis heme-transporting ATPase CcmA [Vibrio fluvialis]EKO3375372.1 cytochrome c biogenesis heme-transporting ATPase CcmA [Vibrio fluvialis]EKO3383330.1 cytochrome c biogenesis heme-transporting ATPase CcmA [Vibrio fluvialis]EKO3389945.1 cytochrome c biogenesis heme-transporting ATPase CcmA [Vibrio fluvialis]EKO3402822.1 cytochrome c biogenesis heme-transporting ATPase CcmA [Vibrio fluviali